MFQFKPLFLVLYCDIFEPDARHQNLTDSSAEENVEMNPRMNESRRSNIIKKVIGDFDEHFTKVPLIFLAYMLIVIIKLPKSQSLGFFKTIRL